MSLSIKVRIKARLFPEPLGPMCNVLAGSDRRGYGGCFTLGSLTLRGFTSGIYLERAAQHPSTSMDISLVWSGTSTSFVSNSNSQQSEHLLFKSILLHTYLAQSWQDKALIIPPTACPILFKHLDDCVHYGNYFFEMSTYSTLPGHIGTLSTHGFHLQEESVRYLNFRPSCLPLEGARRRFQ